MRVVRKCPIVGEPQGAVYRALLGVCVELGAATASLVVGEPSGPALEVAHAFERTVWNGPVVELPLTEPNLALLGAAVDGLFGWRAPDRPEDLSLHLVDETPILVADGASTWLLLTDAERRVVRDRLPVLGL